MKRLGRPFTIILLAFLLLVGILAVRAWKEKNSLQQNSKLVTGRITSSTTDIINGTDRMEILFTYDVGGKTFEGRTTLEEMSRYGSFMKLSSSLRHQPIAVFYDSLNPSFNKAALLESEWKEYGVVLTDSIRKAFVIFDNVP